ncbi:MAG: hypothetical protein AAF532_05865 [Planctomycetota bacterium]
MPQILGLWRDTKLLWLFFVVLIVAMTVFVEPLCLLMLAVLPFMFVYFAINRYDAGGRAKSDP